MVSVTTDRRLGLAGDKGIKAPVKAATTSNITLSGEQTIDGAAVVSGDRVLVKNQTAAVDNGIWDVATGAWSRSIDANGNYDLVKGTTVLVTDGSTQGGSYWNIVASNPITVSTTAITWARGLASALSSVSFLQAGSGAVSRGALGKAREPFSLFDFMTDTQIASVQAGLNTFDAGAVVNVAVAAIKALGYDGGDILLPLGTYDFSTAAVLDASPVGGFRLIGQGFGPSTGAPSVTRIRKAATMTSAVIEMRSPGCGVENLIVEGVIGNTGDGIWMKRDHSSIRNVMVWRMGGDGVRIGTTTATDNVNFWRLDNVWSFLNGGDGCRVISGNYPSAPNTNAGTATHLHVSNNTGIGLRLHNASMNTIIGVTCENNTGNGIVCEAGGSSNKFLGGDVAEGNGTWDISVEANAVGNAFFHVQCQRSRASLGVAGTRTLWLGFHSDSTEAFLLEGLMQVAMRNALANDINADQAGGYFRFCVNGDSPTDANAVLRLRNDYSLVIGKNNTNNYAISFVLTGSKTWSPGAIANGAMASTTLTITGLVVGDQCLAGHSQPLAAGMSITAHCNAADTATITIKNDSGGSQTPASGTVKVTAIRQG